MMYIFILALLVKSIASYGGYDSGGGNSNTCGRPYRAGKMHIPPCSLNKEGGYCVTAGDNYPWRAVRRFVNENQGLMKRMYGDQAEDSLLREEFARMASFEERHPRADPPQDIENELSKNEDDFDFKNEYELQFEGRLLHDEDVLKTKFIYSEEPTLSLKLAGLKTAPHFRQVTSTSTEIPTTTSTTSSTITTTSPTTTTSKTNDTTTRNIVFPEAQDDLDDSTTASLREVDEISGTTESTLEPTSSTSSGEQNVKSTSPAPITTSTEEIIDDDATVVETDQSGAVLFQDMDEEASKVKVDYKMEGVNACPVRVDIVAPYWANNSRGEVLALLNMYPFQQYVHLEKCTYENRQMYCRDGCRCEQQYRLHRLLAYDPKNECKGIFSDWFRFPSCCLCKCYGLPPEFRVTSRSPRHKDQRWYNTVPNGD